MFIEQGKFRKNFGNIWWLIGSIVASFIGQIPLLVGFKYEVMINGSAYPS
jgi:hypothetical protein